jgi:hypothetical protein
MVGTMTDEQEHTVYRCFNEANELLYVGLSVCADKRLEQHAYSSGWFKEVAYTERQIVATRAEAFEVEAKAIEEENPKHNKRGGQKPVPLKGNRKDAVLNVRLKAEVKQLLVVAAKKERRSISNMVEIIIRGHCK